MTLSHKLKRILRFSFTGMCGLTIDTIILWLLSRYIFFSCVSIYVIAPAISFEFAAVTNYLLGYNWVWHDRTQKSLLGILNLFATYNAAAAMTFFVKLIILLFTQRLLGLDVIYCNFIAVASVAIINYLTFDRLVFKN